jgi:RNA polymerase sigma-70 factor, ECF subfamily
MDDTCGQAHWARWIQEYAPRLLLFARQQTRAEADAQDLVQEAILEAVKRQGDGTPPPPALVFATIRRRAVDLARSEGRRATRELAACGSAAEPWFDTAVEDREQARLIQEAMSRLPENYRAVLTLKLWGELTFAEIAGTLGIPPNTAASRYRYALEQMRKLVKEVVT